MTERRMKASNPEYLEYNWLQTLLCWLKNPFILLCRVDDFPQPETKAMEQIIKDQQQEYLDTGVFADYINRALKVE